MLELTLIQKSFQGKQVLDIPYLRLEKGIYWLKGSNGSGKSTLLRLIAGLLPGKGDINIEGVSLTHSPVAFRLLVNHAPAEPVFPPFISGDELISFVSAVKQGSAAQVKEIKEMLEIGHYTNNPTGSYSSGMLKKLSLLLAFTGCPKWILLDEPFTTLDMDAQRCLYTLIAERHKSGVSFIITSHHELEIPAFQFTRICRLHDTKLTEEPAT